MAFVVGTGSAFGHHYTTEQMKCAFHKQRVLAGDVECDFNFANRVFDACGFDGHSVRLPKEDLFRRMSRSEYLEHRKTNLLDMAFEAAERALAMWGGDRQAITHLFWGTMTGGMQSPTLDILMAKRLGLSLDVERTSIEGMGCLTGFRLMNLARGVAMGDPNARILCLEGELRSAIGNSLPDKASRCDIVSAALFRDCASAAVVAGSVQHNETGYYQLIAGMSRIVADSDQFADYKELDCGAIRLHLDKGLPAAVASAEPEFARALVKQAELRGFDVPSIEQMDLVLHTGGPKVLKEVGVAAGVPEEALASSWAVMKAHGNLSGASNLAVLDHHNHHCGSGHADNKWVVCLSMGPGVCIEGVLCRRLASFEDEAGA